MKIHVSAFQIGEYAVDEILLIEYPPFWQDFQNNEFPCGEK
jgi:hypothetical protein